MRAWRGCCACAEPVEKKSKLEENGASASTVANGNAWCCSFADAPDSPDLRPLPPSSAAAVVASPAAGRKLPPKSPSTPSFHGLPTSSRLAGLGRLIDPRRILSSGRVFPIDPDAEEERGRCDRPVRRCEGAEAADPAGDDAGAGVEEGGSGSGVGEGAVGRRMRGQGQ